MNNEAAERHTFAEVNNINVKHTFIYAIADRCSHVIALSFAYYNEVLNKSICILHLIKIGDYIMDKEQWVNTNVDHFLPDTETWKERLKETDKEYAVIKDKIIHTLSNINAYLRDNWDDIYTCAKDIKFATFVNYQYPYIASVYGDEERIVFDNFILTKQGIKNINYDYIIDDILTFQGKDVIKSKVITAVINSIRCICDMHGRITNIRNSTKKAQEK